MRKVVVKAEELEEEDEGEANEEMSPFLLLSPPKTTESMMGGSSTQFANYNSPVAKFAEARICLRVSSAKYTL